MRRLHADEVATDESLVRRLLAAQFPDWASLSVQAVPSDGTDNAMYRIGDTMAARLPRRLSAVEQLKKEAQWLARIAPHLPLPVPVVLAQGSPAHGFPWVWSVCRWVEGEKLEDDSVADASELARDLAAFVEALRGIDAAGGPAPGAHNAGRGARLAERDPATRAAIAALRGVIDVEAAARAWEGDLDAPVWRGAPQWIHGDLSAGNLLVRNGRLSGVIDFGCLSVGDPACDLQVAWNLFSGAARVAYRAALGVDDATWARGRGWALSVALRQLPYYRETNPVIAVNALRTIGEVLIDHADGQ